MRRHPLLPVVLAATAATAGVCGACLAVKRAGIGLYPNRYRAQGELERLEPTFEGKDVARQRIPVALREVVSGSTELVGGAFLPGNPDLFIGIEKGGTARWARLGSGRSGEWFTVQVTTESEQGLLGLAFHPRYLENGRLYLNYTTRVGKREVSRVEEWGVDDPRAAPPLSPRPRRVLLEVDQPYQNHNGGHLAFGPDGYLYVGFGDGGYAGDPHGHGQNPATLLGAMLRIDVNREERGRPYAIPADNPFRGRAGFREEIWLLGLRNPWRYAFDAHGRLVIGDVGQSSWEEIHLARGGENLGWNVREGRHCYSPRTGCPRQGYLEPVYEYGHDEGQSVTGGRVYRGKAVPALAGKYVFGDFVSGRLWALDLPATPPDGALLEAYALGKWPILPTSFVEDADGELYVCDFQRGALFRLTPPG